MSLWEEREFLVDVIGLGEVVERPRGGLDMRPGVLPLESAWYFHDDIGSSCHCTRRFDSQIPFKNLEEKLTNALGAVKKEG